MRETSLEEFVDVEPDADPDSRSDEGEREGGDGDVAPAVATYGSSPSGAACSACGAVVERRWNDGDGMVCSECKSW